MAVEKSLFNFNKAPAAANATKEGKPQAETWLNIGIDVEVPQEDGSTKTVFISLPQGIALDTAEPMKMGNTAEWNEQVQTRNHILEVLQKAAMDLAPGEGMIVGELKAQIFRRKPKVAPAAGENSLLNALKAKMG